MKFTDLPKTWRGISLEVTDIQSIADKTNKYTLNFKYGQLSSNADFYIPKLDGNRFSLNGLNYIVWYRFCKPICSIEYIDNIHTVSINHIMTRPDRPENYNLNFYLERDEVVCQYGDKVYNIDNSYLHDILYSYWLTPSDREILNEYIDSDSKESSITLEDVEKISVILKENPDYTTNWKEIKSMRVIGLEDLVISIIMLALPSTLKDFFKKGVVNSEVLTRNIRSFLSTDAPEIRLDMSETEIASYSQNNKVILPFDNYCSVNEIVPDPSWYEYLDMLDAPQSIKVGSVASLTGNVIIKNKQLVIG